MLTEQDHLEFFDHMETRHKWFELLTGEEAGLDMDERRMQEQSSHRLNLIKRIQDIVCVGEGYHQDLFKKDPEKFYLLEAAISDFFDKAWYQRELSRLILANMRKVRSAGSEKTDVTQPQTLAAS